jgi:hypothetical protein
MKTILKILGFARKSGLAPAPVSPRGSYTYSGGDEIVANLGENAVCRYHERGLPRNWT